ncbi:MAG: carboxypeptidase regulatory-like domain-containing protein, partial [Fibrobacter sp.]|nr:carboxypeptidase regulatory-like domain-containing protein [Fibrobacter sp.]
MMHFKLLHITSALALATIFSACSEENHAGVLTETESGTTIASIEGSVTNEKGKPVASAKVSLISADHIAARMAPIKTATTDKSGKYTIDSVSAGDYALQISNTERTQSGYQTITVEDDKTDTQKLKPATSLEENASLKLKLSAYSLDKGDTLCITGTLNCIAVDDKSVKAGTVTLEEIPPMEFTNIALIRKADHKVMTQDVQWDFVPGETLEVSSIQIPVVISEETMKQAKLLNDKTTLDSMIVPVTLSTSLENPILLSDKGDTLALYKVENDKNNSKYLTVIPNIDVGTYTFTVASSESVIRPTQIKKASGVTEPGMRITNSESWQAFGNVLGISFWVTKDSLSSAKDSVYVDTRE